MSGYVKVLRFIHSKFELTKSANSRDFFGFTPLMLAVPSQKINVYLFRMKNFGPDAGTPGGQGFTALDYACILGEA